MPRDVRLLSSESCVICGEECPGEARGPGNFDIHRKATNNMRSGVGIISMSFGYGSTHDTMCLYGVICDDCSRTLVETAAEPFSSDGALGSHMSNTVDMRDTNEEAQDSEGKAF